jgi:hypothetical protein
VPRILPIVKSIYKSGENRDPPRKKLHEKFGCVPIRSYIYGVELKKQLKIKVMNALNEIQNEAKVIVEQLADRQINDMKKLNDEFNVWLEIDGNAVINNWGNNVDLYNTAYKYVYMNFYRVYNRETCVYEKPKSYNNTYEERTAMGYSKNLMYMVNDLRTMIASNWEVKYRELFIAANMVKLNRALAKDITNEMIAQDIHVSVGGDGAEVTAIINQTKRFKSFGTLCGGDVQCYHYRYRSSLKPIKGW